MVGGFANTDKTAANGCEKMTDYIYNSITEMPDDVLKSEIYKAEKLYKEWPLIFARWHLQILKHELAKRREVRKNETRIS